MRKMEASPEPRQPESQAGEVTFRGKRFAEKDPESVNDRSKTLPDCLIRVPWLLLLLIALGLFSVLLLATLVQVSRIPRCLPRENQDQQSPSLVAAPHQQIPSSLEQIHHLLTQINASLAGLCRPCPWDWELFQGSCYLFSRTLGSWQASVSACQNLGSHLVIVNSIEEQRFLKYWPVRKNELTWIGLSDHKREGSWQWVDHTPLQLSFWKEGEPNNHGNEDCVELLEDTWNDKICTAQNFWVCEQPATPCPDPRGSLLL